MVSDSGLLFWATLYNFGGFHVTKQMALN